MDKQPNKEDVDGAFGQGRLVSSLQDMPRHSYGINGEWMEPMPEEELRSDIKEIRNGVFDLRVEVSQLRGDIARLGVMESKIETMNTKMPKIEIRLDRLERSQSIQGKFFWIAASVVVALAIKAVVGLF